MQNAIAVGLLAVMMTALGACRDGEAPAPPAAPAASQEAAAPSRPALAPEQAAAGPAYVWWEAEDYEQTNLPNPQAPFPGDITQRERDRLSGGVWLATQGPESASPYFVTWKVDVPRTGDYGFWVRKFWKHGPFRWQFDDGEWRTCGRDVALHDETFLRKFTGANWVFLGQVALESGGHSLRIEMVDPAGGGAVDCFVLADGPFVPRGKLRPGEKTGLAGPGYFAWEPDADPLGDDCPIDLRHLNEPAAGQDGFVRREGSGFTLGSGEPVRFWMVQGSSLMGMKPEMIDYWARRLAKYGVNLVRVQMSGLYGQWKRSTPAEFAGHLDRLHYLISALKSQGIYTYLGHLWWHTSTQVSEAEGFPGYGGGRSAFGLLYVNPDARRMYLDWVNALVNTPNPYTGLPVSEDPAVAFIEIQNESSLFFWTFNPQQMVGQTRERLERLFADWAAETYGSLDAALDAWGPENAPSAQPDGLPDALEDGRLALYSIGALTVNDWAAAQRNPRRASDQLRFMTGLQRGFYEDMVRAWREQLGVKNLIATSNWKTADPRNLGVLERYLYTAGDVVCRNVYFDVDYDPAPERFYAIDVGDTYTDHSSLKPPAIPAPFTIAHVNDYPDMYTENNWCRPNRYRVEWPFLVATYGPMMGVDGWTFFSLDAATWTSQMQVWEVNCPSILGQFPAAALTFRKGYVEEAPPAVTEHMSLEHLYEFGRAALFELGGSDALWESRIGDLEGAADQASMEVDRRAFFIGKVDRAIGAGDRRIEMVDLDEYIDEENKTVRSLNGQLRWYYGAGVVAVDTPNAQGACGFLAEAGPIELGDVTIDSANEYGAVMVVSLDGRPLATSQSVLIQAGTEDWPYGFATEPADGKQRISSLGGYPMNVRHVKATVTLKGGDAGDAVVLDGNGYRTRRRADATAGLDGVTIRLPEDSLYTLVE